MCGLAREQAEAVDGPALTTGMPIVGARLEAGAPDLRTLAGALGLAPRTLQRRLQAEGETLAGLVDAVRRARAAELLATAMPLAEVSQRLGYAEPSVFFRAFRRWTGCTPEGYRRRLATVEGT